MRARPPEVGTHVRLQNQVFGTRRPAMQRDAAHRFLGHLNRDRGMAGDLVRHVHDSFLQFVAFHDLVHETEREHLPLRQAWR